MKQIKENNSIRDKEDSVGQSHAVAKLLHTVIINQPSPTSGCDSVIGRDLIPNPPSAFGKPYIIYEYNMK